MESSDNDDLKGPTLVLAAINLIQFIITSIVGGSIISIGGDAMVIFGLSFPSLTHGYLWTPFTSIITHSGIAHLGGNMIFLLVYGFKLEEEGFNDKQIYFSYVITGLVAGLLSLIIIPDAFQVGASGSVFGILGVNYGYQSVKKNPDAKKVLYTGIILLILASGENTNVFAHLFGLITGIIIARSDYLYTLGDFSDKA